MPGGAVIERRGSGPDLVLVHGWAMHSGVWGDFADRLAARFTLHLVDLPGHGAAGGGAFGTLEELACQVLDAVPTAAWLGWSLGGQVALTAARKRPPRVTGLVLLCANPRFVAGDGWPDAMPPGDFDAFDSAFKADARAAVERFLGLMVADTSSARATLAELRRRLFSRPLAAPASLQAGLDTLRRTDLTPALPEVACRALWIAGACDRRTPPVCMRRAADLMPAGTWVSIDDAGHAPFISHRDQVIQVVSEFLAAGADP